MTPGLYIVGTKKIINIYNNWYYSADKTHGAGSSALIKACSDPRNRKRNLSVEPLERKFKVRELERPLKRYICENVLKLQLNYECSPHTLAYIIRDITRVNRVHYLKTLIFFYSVPFNITIISQSARFPVMWPVSWTMNKNKDVETLSTLWFLFFCLFFLILKISFSSM